MLDLPSIELYSSNIYKLWKVIIPIYHQIHNQVN